MDNLKHTAENIRNLQAAKDLVNKYNSITISQIENEYDKEYFISKVKRNLTGFGLTVTCTLCKNIAFAFIDSLLVSGKWTTEA